MLNSYNIYIIHGRLNSTTFAPPSVPSACGVLVVELFRDIFFSTEMSQIAKIE